MERSRAFPYKELIQPSDKTIVFAVIDGLGGLPHPQHNWLTELEGADTPELDRIARESTCGTHVPLGPGITPGSVPAHLSIFGYDPFEYQVGRGVIEALGLGLELSPDDIAIRCNWCTLDNNGLIVDRRAGRPSNSVNAEHVERLSRSIDIPDAEVLFYPGSEHRFVTIIRGAGLKPYVTDTDPQAIGRPILTPSGIDTDSARTADIVHRISLQAREIFHDEPTLNGFTMRGFSQRPNVPGIESKYGMKAGAVVTHPAYKGISAMLGMEQVAVDGKRPENVLKALQKVWGQHEFYYLHFKWPDAYGENGDFIAKADEIGQIDKVLAGVFNLNPDVFVVTGDHATPSLVAGHSSDPVPTLIWSKNCFRDDVSTFGERTTQHGYLGHRIHGNDIMPHVLALSDRLKKFGA